MSINVLIWTIICDEAAAMLCWDAFEFVEKTRTGLLLRENIAVKRNFWIKHLWHHSQWLTISLCNCEFHRLINSLAIILGSRCPLYSWGSGTQQFWCQYAYFSARFSISAGAGKSSGKSSQNPLGWRKLQQNQQNAAQAAFNKAIDKTAINWRDQDQAPRDHPLEESLRE